MSQNPPTSFSNESSDDVEGLKNGLNFLKEADILETRLGFSEDEGSDLSASIDIMQTEVKSNFLSPDKTNETKKPPRKVGRPRGSTKKKNGEKPKKNYKKSNKNYQKSNKKKELESQNPTKPHTVINVGEQLSLQSHTLCNVNVKEEIDRPSDLKPQTETRFKKINDFFIVKGKSSTTLNTKRSGDLKPQTHSCFTKIENFFTVKSKSTTLDNKQHILQSERKNEETKKPKPPKDEEMSRIKERRKNSRSDEIKDEKKNQNMFITRKRPYRFRTNPRQVDDHDNFSEIIDTKQKPKVMKLYLTGYGRGNSQKKWTKKLKRIGVKVVKDIKDATHVSVMGKKRTISVLIAMCQGCDIIKHSWVKEVCKNNNKDINTQRYSSFEFRSFKGEFKLFLGEKIHVALLKDKSMEKEIIKLLKLTDCSRDPRRNGVGILIGDGVGDVSKEWLFDCIQKHEFLSTLNYIIKANH
ncbi:hypothetical protein QTN25_000502 [Entamoeba marina]